jgi:ribosomal protein S18 acetylase RimI-like enzyme
MSGKTSIRVAKVEDTSEITQVHTAAWRTTYRGIVPQETLDNINVERREQMWREMLSDPERDDFVLVAETETGEVVGFASGGPERGEGDYDGELYAIYILEEFQRQGIGRRLTERVIQRLIADGFSSMLLWVLKDNAGSRGFYEKMGGELVGEKQYEIGGKLLDAVGYGWKDIKSK